jgi:hydrophobic/amphiphilic exporter-1 (mainly G- bacteria), HAE1 family
MTAIRENEMKLSRSAVRHPAIVLIITAALFIFGVLAIMSMNREFLPNISLPSISVISYYPGVGPEDIEEQVTDPLEDQFSTLPELKKMTSTSGESISVISLEFNDGVDPYNMLSEVRANVTLMRRNLPDDLEGDPIALVAGVDMMPIFSFAVRAGNDAERTNRLVQDEVIPQITRIPGVATVRGYGGRSQRVSIKLRIDDLNTQGVSVLDLFTLLNYTNITMPAGVTEFRSEELFLKVEGRYSSLTEIEELIVGSTGVTPIYLKDIADVAIEYPEPEIYIDSNGQSVIVVDITKREDGNTLEIAESVHRALAEVEEAYGGAVSFSILQDDSGMVETSLNTVIRSGLLGVGMAVLVILIFLGNIRATLIIAVSVPLSIVFTFIGMYLSGQTMNVLSMAGIVVALGMVVDGSIVVLEQIYRHYYEGSNVFEAADKGTSEVGGAVFASTSTTVGVFLPLLFLTGLIGVIMKDISLTIVFSLTASLAVSLTIVPLLSTRLLKNRTDTDGKPKHPRFQPGAVVLVYLIKGYRWLLNLALRSRTFVIILSISILLISVVIVGALGITFIPSTDSGEIYVYMSFPGGFTINQTRERVLGTEVLIRQMVPEIDTAVFFTGYASEFSRNSANSNAGYAKILLVPVSERERSIQDIIQEIQQVIPSNIPDIDLVVENGGFDKLMGLATGGAGFQIRLSSDDFAKLYETAVKIDNILSDDPEVVKTVIDTKIDGETIVADLALNYLGIMGITSYEAAITSRILFTGMEIGQFSEAVPQQASTDSGTLDLDTSSLGSTARKKTLPIYLVSDVSGKTLTQDLLQQITLQTSSGKSVAFSSISEMKLEPTVSHINHTNRMKTIVVTGYLSGEDTSGVNERISAHLQGEEMPYGVSWEIAGSSALFSDSISTLLLALGISLFLVYMVMVIQFERFVHPILVMVSVPFCFIGVILGLLIFGSSLSIVALLGIIALGGIVVNNAIVLIDYMNLLRSRLHRHDETLDAKVAVLRKVVLNGAASRLRPILMTTLTTFFGVLPMALSKGGGSEIYAPLGQAVAGGLITSTLITLFLVPILYFSYENRKLREISMLEAYDNEDIERKKKKTKQEEKSKE